MVCRYLSNTAAKYLFRADKLDDAQRMATRFTKDGEHDNNLHDMQCTWYEIENGQAHLRQHAHGKVQCCCSPQCHVRLSKLPHAAVHDNGIDTSSIATESGRGLNAAGTLGLHTAAVV